MPGVSRAMSAGSSDRSTPRPPSGTSFDLAKYLRGLPIAVPDGSSTAHEEPAVAFIRQRDMYPVGEAVVSRQLAGGSAVHWTRTSRQSRRGGPPAGFTVVELLVVVAVIAVLLAILLPTLNQAKRKAQSVACASNLRRLHLASILFSQDNHGHLPRPHQAGDLSSNAAAARVCVWLHLRAGAAGHADFGDDKGVLWKYLAGGPAVREAVVSCPGDVGEAPMSAPVDERYPRNYSYSMNWLVAAPHDAARKSGGRAFLPGIRVSRVQRPAEKILWYEELAPNDSWNRTQLSLAEFPSARHGKHVNGNARLDPINPDYSDAGRGNFCFFDGHVESLSPQDVLNPRNSGLHRPLLPGDLE